MNEMELIKAIDANIDKHHSKASEMLGVVQFTLFLGVVILFLYVAPGVSERAFPKLDEEAKAERVAYAQAKSDFEAKYKTKYYSISEKEFDKHVENGTADEKIKAAMEISTMDRGDGLPLKITSVISKLKVEDSKIEFVLKVLPYVIGVVLAGFLFTYRLHVISAKELASKKFDIIARSPKKSDVTANPPVNADSER